MNQLRVLLHKEWRDQRALVIGGIVACVLVRVLDRVLFGQHERTFWSGGLVLPCCEWTFALVLAVEVITRDVAHGVEGTFLRLPVSRLLAWRAKIVFVVLASFALLVALTITTLEIRAFDHGSLLDGLRVMYQPLNWLYGGVLATAAFASACVLRRSLPAAVVGVVLVAGLPLCATHLLDGRASEWCELLLNSWTRTAFASLACIAFLLGSFLAFRVRRADPSGLRRASAVALALGLVFVPLLTGTAGACAWALDILPFSRTVEIERVVPSPDGRCLAVQVGQEWKPRDPWIDFGHGLEGRRRRSEVWLYDITRKTWSTLDARCRELDPNASVWGGDGFLRTRSGSTAFATSDWNTERVDPATGVVQALDSAEHDWFTQMAQSRESVTWAWRGRGISLRLPANVFSVPSPQAGVVFHEQDGFLVRHELDPDATTRIAQLHGPLRLAPSISPDGRFLLLDDARESAILDACDGRVLQRLDAGLLLREWSRTPGRVAVLVSGTQRLALEEDGTLVLLPALAANQLPLGRHALVRFEAQRIEITGIDGSERETIYEVKP